MTRSRGLGDWSLLVDWRAPTSFADSCPRRTPHFLSIGESQHDKKRVGGIVTDQGDTVVVDRGRAGVSPAYPVFTDVDDAQITAPLQIAI